jgi:hypothetical protein
MRPPSQDQSQPKPDIRLLAQALVEASGQHVCDADQDRDGAEQEHGFDHNPAGAARVGPRASGLRKR